MSLRDRVAIITGASGNLGRACLACFADRGAKLVAVHHGEAPPDAAAGGTLNLGGVDLSREEAAEEVARAARGHFGRVDILINTVGGFRGGTPVVEEDLATWDALFAINLRTALLACRAVVPGMLAQGRGAVVNVAAGAALTGPAGLAAYSASKVALLRLTESLARETRGQGVRVNAVLPGTIDTPQNRRAMPDADPAKWIRPEALAEVIAFLASDQARAITGVGLPVLGDG